MKDELVERFTFSLPDGDAGLVDEHRYVDFYPRGAADYEAGSRMVFHLEGNGLVLDPTESYIDFKLRVYDPVLTAANVRLGLIPVLPAGTSGLIKNVKITSMSSVELEYLQKYNRTGAVLDRWQLDDQWIRDEGPLELYPPNTHTVSKEGAHTQATPVTSLSTSTWEKAAAYTAYVWHTENNASTKHDAGAYGLSGEYHRMYTPLISDSAFSTEGADCIIRLRHSDIFGKRTVVPLDELGHLRVEIELEDAAVALRYLRLRAYESDVKNSMGAVSYDIAELDGITGTTAAPSYKLIGPVFRCRMLRLSPHMREAMNNATNNEGLPMVLNTWYTSSTGITATHSTPPPNSYTIPKTVANAKSLIAYVCLADGSWVAPAAGDHKVTTTIISGVTATDLASTRTSEVWRDSFDTWHHGLDYYRVRLGTQYYPQNEAKTVTQKYMLTKNAIPMKGKKMPGVPLIQYDHKRTDYAGLRRNYTGINDLVRVETSPNRVVHGISLQSVPGLTLSGLTTNNGNQLCFEAKWDQINSNTSVTTGATTVVTENDIDVFNSQTWRPATIYYALLYTRLVVITKGHNVSIRE